MSMNEKTVRGDNHGVGDDVGDIAGTGKGVGAGAGIGVAEKSFRQKLQTISSMEESLCPHAIKGSPKVLSITGFYFLATRF